MEDRNVLIKIRGEADMTDAQLQLQEMAEKEKQLRREMADLAAAEKHFIQQQQALTESGKAESAQLNKLIAEHRQYRRDVQEEINANQKNITTLKQAISSYNAQQGACRRTALQIRELREEIAKMEMAGDTSSERFVELSVKAAKLTDQMGDTQKQIRILASDTANLDAVMNIGGGLAGAFSAATSAAALLGDENEALQKSFLQVQAAMAVLNGVQQVANALNKDSAANVVIRTALNKLFNKTKVEEAVVTSTSTTMSVADTGAKTAQAAATNVATKATNKLTAAMLKNPAALIVVAIAALVAGIVYLTEKTKEAAEKQRDFNGELERYDTLAKRAAKDTEFAAQMAAAEGKSEEEILQIRRDASKKQLAEAEALYEELQSRKRKAKNKISEDEQKAIDEALQRQINAQDELRSINNEFSVLEAKQRKDAADKAVESAKKRNEEIKAAEKELSAARIRLMEEGKDKEIAQIRNEYAEKIRAIKGNSETEKQLRIALNKEMNQKIAEAEAADLRKRLDEARTLSMKILDIEMQQAKEGTTLYADLLKERYEAEVEYARKTIENQTELGVELDRLATELEVKLNANDEKIASSRIESAKKAAERRISEEENADLRILASSESTNEERKAAAEDLANHEVKVWAAREDELNAMRDAGLISEADYQQGMLDIERERLDQSLQMQQEHAAQVRQMTTETLNFLGEMSSIIFGAVSDNISQQLEDLDNLYTTDAEEAEKDANKKYITEKELADKKLALQQKQAKLDKAEAVFQIGLSTAMAIMRIWADVPKADFGVSTAIMTAMAAAIGAAQIAAALAKPLPQYAKGRKGGKGEYAIVGERGAEMMYIPDGASIVPHNKLNDPESWGAYGVPAMPGFDAISLAGTFGGSIDYDRLGKAVAANLPKQKAVSVNVDRNGVLVSEEYGSTKYLNQKYTGRWI